LAKIVVTGGAGFIGSHVAEHFAGNHEVVVCDNLSRSEILGKFKALTRYNWNYLSHACPTIKLLPVDVRNPDAIRDVAKEANVIIHSAGQVTVTKSLEDPRRDFEVNATGTFNVLEAARSNDSALIFCSTNKVYGENVNAVPVKTAEMDYSYSDPVYANGIPENFPIDHTRHSPYGASKLAADIYVQDYAHTYGLRTAVFRMSCIYGERQFGVEDQGWVAWFTIATLTGKPITVYGDGRQVRDVLYVKDLVGAFERFYLSTIRHAVFNIGGGPTNTLSLLKLLQLLHEITGKSPQVSFGDWRPADQKVYVSDIRKVQEKLGWKPATSPQDGVKRLANWVRENRSLFES
jgi:CDP-paratose 2-epimerase